MTVDEDDYLRHQVPAATVTDWSSCATRYSANWPGSVRRSPASSLDQVTLLFALDEPVTDPAIGRALIAVCSEYELMGSLLDFASSARGGARKAARERAHAYRQPSSSRSIRGPW